jgi:hypothetical protein
MNNRFKCLGIHTAFLLILLSCGGLAGCSRSPSDSASARVTTSPTNQEDSVKATADGGQSPPTAQPGQSNKPAPEAPKSPAEASLQCLQNLKQIGLAFRVWAGDYKGRYPFNVGTNEGGTKEFCARGTNNLDRNAFEHLKSLSNELNDPKILVCPMDRTKLPLQGEHNFQGLQSSNVSYQVRSGPNIGPTAAGQVMVICPIHGFVVMGDSSLRQLRKPQ